MQMQGQGQGQCREAAAAAAVGAAAVMTEEQIETLRRQISVYATICQQLVQMHKAMVAHQTSISGFRPGQGPTGDPNNNMHVTGSRLSSRQRWTPSQTQLQLLEKFFEQENGAPSKQRIKEITAELSQHGQISETNVYNWFQNRRARSKRKNVGGGERGGATNALESEVETDGEVPIEKKPKVEEHLGFIHKSEHLWSDEQRGMMHSVKSHGTSFNIPSDPSLNRNVQLEEHLYVPECESLY